MNSLTLLHLRTMNGVTFRATYWLSSAYFILLPVFRFFLFLFFLNFCGFYHFLVVVRKVCQYLKQSIGVVPRFVSDVSRGELLQPYLVINVAGLVQFGKNLSCTPPLAS